METAAGVVTCANDAPIPATVDGIATALPPIDWDRAWLAPMRHSGQAVTRACAEGTPLWQALNQAGPAPVRFVPQSELPAGTAYEAYIGQTGLCPTRAGLHDFFNGLCWIRFPATKRRLNQLQSAQIAADGVRSVRGPVRDALTLFDENAAFLSAPSALWEALAAKQWQDLFGRLRPLWLEAQLLLFGHALLEKLQQPRKPITAHVYRIGIASQSITDIDEWVARDLRSDHLAHKPFAHLPVLGVPHWWAANAIPGFYDDAAVFRPPRRASHHRQ